MPSSRVGKQVLRIIADTGITTAIIGLCLRAWSGVVRSIQTLLKRLLVQVRPVESVPGKTIYLKIFLDGYRDRFCFALIV